MKNDGFYRMVAKHLTIMNKTSRIPSGLLTDYASTAARWMAKLPPSAPFREGSLHELLDTEPKVLTTSRDVSFFMVISMSTYIERFSEDEAVMVKRARQTLADIRGVTTPFIPRMDISPYSRSLSGQPFAFGISRGTHSTLPKELSAGLFLSVRLNRL